MRNYIAIRTQNCPDDVRSIIEADLRLIFTEVQLEEETFCLSTNLPTWLELLVPEGVLYVFLKGMIEELGKAAGRKVITLSGEVWEKAKSHLQPDELYRTLMHARERISTEFEVRLAFYIDSRLTRLEMDLGSKGLFLNGLLLLARSFEGIRKVVKRLADQNEDVGVGIECKLELTGFSLRWGVCAALIKEQKFDFAGDPI